MNLNDIDISSIVANERLAEEYRRECQAESRLAEFRLLGRSESNTKLRKSMRTDYRIVSLNLAHHRSAGAGMNVCEQASAACSSACVGGDNVGLASIFKAVMQGRIMRTKYLFADRQKFIRQLIGELTSEADIAERLGAVCCARLNCFSDIAWESAEFGMIPQMLPMVHLWDYSKRHHRIGKTPDNYALCASWSELKRHQSACLALLNNGHNVAISFHNNGHYAGNRAMNQTLPGWITLDGQRFEVFDGDNGTGPGCGDVPHYDLRFLDPGPTRSGRGRVCGLRLKSGNNVTRDLAISRGFSWEVRT